MKGTYTLFLFICFCGICTAETRSTTEMLKTVINACKDEQLSTLVEEIRIFEELREERNKHLPSKKHILISVIAARGHFNPIVELGLELAVNYGDKYDVSFAVGLEVKKWLQQRLSKLKSNSENIYSLPGGGDTFYSVNSCQYSKEHPEESQHLQYACMRERLSNPLIDLLGMSASSDSIFYVLNQTMAHLKEENRPDIMIVDQYSFGGSSVGDLWGIPVIINMPQLLSGAAIFPLDYLELYMPLTGSLNNLELKNIIIKPLLWSVLKGFDYYFGMLLSKHRVEAGLPSVVPFGDINRNRLVLSNTAFGFEWPRWIPPNVIPVGPLATFAIQDESLNSDSYEDALESFLQSCEGKKIVLLSMGTAIAIDQQQASFFLSEILSFGEPAASGTDSHKDDFCLIWSLPSSQVHVLSDQQNSLPNLFIRNYLPQTKLLQDNRLNAFISHCGMGSAQEALVGGKPLLCIPLGSDQFDISDRVRDSGAGEQLFMQLDGYKRDSLRSALLRIITDPSYLANANRISKIFKAAGGARRAAKIVDEIVEIGNYNHLISLDQKLSFSALYAPIIITLVVYLLALFVLCCFCCYSLRLVKSCCFTQKAKMFVPLSKKRV